MAVADRTLMLKLIADVNQPAKQMKGMGASLKKAGSAAKAWGKAFAGALVIGGIEKLVDSLGDAEHGFVEGEDAARKLGRTWKNLGRPTKQLGGLIDDLSTSALNLGFDDAEVLNAFNTFMAKSGSVKQSTEGVQAAMDLARARGITFARAVKLIGGQLGDLDGEMKRNRDQARTWARNHPLQVTVGKISDAWETFVGSLRRGRIQDALGALRRIGRLVGELIFGRDTKAGKHIPGLVDQFAKVGPRIVTAIVDGLNTLGTEVQRIWNEQVATVDWAKAIGDAVAGAAALIGSNPQLATNLGIAAVSIATGLFVASIFANALTTMLKAPELLFSAAVKTAMWALGAALGVTMRVAMWTGQKAISLAETAFQVMLNALPIGPETAIGKAASGLGKGIGGIIQKGIIIGVTLFLLDQIKSEVDKVLDQLGVPRPHRQPVYDPETGTFHMAQGGIVRRPTFALIGEAGPEAVIPLDRMGTGWGGGITVNISTGIGDPVAIGREVDRVLRAWRSRSGTRP